MKHSLSLALFLAALWWLLSGQAQALLLGYGVASVLFSVWLGRRMGLVDRESHPIHMTIGLLRYWALLLREIVVSNAQVVRLILSPKMALQPHFVTVRTSQPTDLGRVILANSITLTPGTVTVSIREDALLVHALTEETAQAVLEGQLDRCIPPDVKEKP